MHDGTTQICRVRMGTEIIAEHRTSWQNLSGHMYTFLQKMSGWIIISFIVLKGYLTTVDKVIHTYLILCCMDVTDSFLKLQLIMKSHDSKFGKKLKSYDRHKQALNQIACVFKVENFLTYMHFEGFVM